MRPSDTLVLRFVDSLRGAAFRYSMRHPSVTQDDLLQVAAESVLRLATRAWTPERGTLWTYCGLTVSGRMRRTASEQYSIVRTPTTRPRLPETAAAWTRIRSQCQRQALEDEAQQPDQSLTGVVLRDEGPGPLELAIEAQERTRVRNAVWRLRDRSRLVLARRFGMCLRHRRPCSCWREEQTLEQIGAAWRPAPISREAVRQIEARALRELSEELSRV
jgi:RNA polymerase sigma factor (sigma-70 family)